MKKLTHEPDQPMNELEALRKSQQIDNAHDFINRLPEQLQAKIQISSWPQPGRSIQG